MIAKVFVALWCIASRLTPPTFCIHAHAQMGTGKTLQALATMACYREEWPLLIVVPASLRLVWAEVAEAWLPFLRPTDIKVTKR